MLLNVGADECKSQYFGISAIICVSDQQKMDSQILTGYIYRGMFFYKCHAASTVT